MLPRKSLTNIDLKKYVKMLQIPNFRGIFMRDKLPKLIRNYENGIINLDDHNKPGSHWTAYVKKKNQIIYYDSFGNLRPPLEVIKYFLSDGSKNKIKYNYDANQTYDTSNCGQLCLEFLYKNGT